jgi:hypothetical protein
VEASSGSTKGVTYGRKLSEDGGEFGGGISGERTGGKGGSGPSVRALALLVPVQAELLAQFLLLEGI